MSTRVDGYAALRRLKLRVNVGIDLLNRPNITNFVANVIKRVRQVVLFPHV